MNTPTYQLENGILICQKQIGKRTKCIKETVESMEEICKNCGGCKQAILLSGGVFCGKMRNKVSNIFECSFFDPEPMEYRLFRRT